MQPVGLDRMMARKSLAERVKRAGADVAEHHANGSDGKLQLAIALMSMAVMGRFCGSRRGAFGAAGRLLRLSSHREPLDEPARLE
jgi:hypothetical protein